MQMMQCFNLWGWIQSRRLSLNDQSARALESGQCGLMLTCALCGAGPVCRYTARWYWHTWRNIRESTTTSELSSYAMPRHYDGSLTSVGDGKLNWRGNPICERNGAGINCYGSRAGSPSRDPQGGHGCNQNLGKGWSGQLEWYLSNTNFDTYEYICEGAQHSSSNRFAHRVWVRSPDSQKDW